MVNYTRCKKLIEKAVELKEVYNNKLEEQQLTHQMYENELAEIRNKITDLAIKCKDEYGVTYDAFSKKIGMTPSTMANWVSDRKRQIPTDELIDEIKEKGEEVNKAAIDRIKKIIKPDTKPREIKKLYNREKKKTSEDLYLERCIEYGDKILAFINQVAITKLDEEKVIELYGFLAKSVKAIENKVKLDKEVVKRLH